MIQAIFCDFYGTLVPEYGSASYEVIRRVCESGSEKNPKAVVAAWWKRYGEKQQAAWGDTFRTQYELALESYQELLEEYHSDFDVLFLDIQLGMMNGMEAAERIRRLDPRVVIVFVTNLAQYAVDGYEVRALDFILKPVTYPGFQMKFDRICKELSHRLDDRSIFLGNRTNTRRVRIMDILYVEVDDHELIFHLTDGKFCMRGTMSDMEKKLSPHHFVRCNSYYLVNLKYVDSLRGDTLLVAGNELRISQSRRQAFLTELARYAGGSV